MRLPPIVSTLIDIRVPSGALVKPAAMCAGEHPWYSFSGRAKHQSGISMFSIGALMIAEKDESTIWFSMLCMGRLHG
jgi:hypothetical protein